MNTINRLFEKEEAQRIVDELNSDPEDDWTYDAVHDPKGTGYSRIEVYNEDGEFVATF
ncbi:MAG: hypothetical protein ISS57_18130 [Anaerolineales bacterium]|nr:hypothetical protein [Anaerolineales bacterium]